MNCSITGILEGKDFYKPLLDKLGSVNKVITYITDSFDGEFNEGFVKWYNTKYGEFNESSLSGEELANKIIEYSRKTPSVSDTTSKKQNRVRLAERGYSDLASREKGLKHLSALVLEIYEDNNLATAQIKGNVVDFYIRRLRAKWNEIIQNRLIANATQGLSEKEAKSKAEEIRIAFKSRLESDAPVLPWLEEQFGENRGIVEKNYLAVWSELNASEANVAAYIDELFCDKNLQFIVRENKEDFDSVQQRRMLDEAAETNGINTGEGESDVDGDVDGDTSIIVANSHLGTYSNYMMHLGERLRLFFNSLPKLDSVAKTDNTTDPYSYALDAEYNLKEYMTAEEVASMLYAINHRFTNPEATIAAIRQVARNVKGYECFELLADKLAEDSDFATELRTVFAKTVISKMQLRVKGDTTTADPSNNRSRPFATMLYNMMNDARASLLNEDDISRLDEAKEFEKLCKNIKKELKNNEEPSVTKQQLLEELVRSIRIYFPSIEVGAITSFVDLNNGANGKLEPCISNILKLNSILQSIIKLQPKTRRTFAGVQAKQDALRGLYGIINSSNENKPQISKAQLQKAISEANADFIDDENQQYFLNLINLLLPYSVVKLKMNSPNVHGNNSSDVINNNYITWMKKVLEQTYKDETTGFYRNPTLEAWGRKRLEETSQFKYSGILLEHKDDTGKVINKGIFTYVGDTLVLTKDAKDLIEMHLFDGASMMDEGENETYNEMGEGGYLPTCFMAYFRPSSLTDKAVDGANYFLRTPSDAPKNFVVRGRKINIAGLITPNIGKDEENIIRTMANNIPYLSAEERDKYKHSVAPFMVIKESEITVKGRKLLNKFLTSGAFTEPLTDSQYVLLNKETQEAATTIVYAAGNRVSTVIKLKGTLSRNKQGKHYIRDAKPIGFFNITGNGTSVQVQPETLLPKFISEVREEYYRNLLKNDNLYYKGEKVKLRRSINVNHPAFILLKNAFKQELLDAAVALDKCFRVNERGYVEDGGNSVDGRKDIVQKTDNDAGYKFYHKGNKGILRKEIVTDENGVEHEEIHLDGAVFHSNRFTLVHEEVVDGKKVVRVENYLDSLIAAGTEELDGNKPFQLLYGVDRTGDEARTKGSFIHVVRNSGENGQLGRITDIELTPYQEQEINKALVNFINDYVNQAVERVNAKSDFIHNVSTSYENVSDFAINYLLFYFNSDDLFEGNTKFYKDSQTILKRAKEVQGSGVPYGLVDYSTVDLFSDAIELTQGSFLNGGKTTHEVAKVVEENGRKVRKWVTEEVSIEDFIRSAFKPKEIDGQLTTNPLLDKDGRVVRQRNKFRALAIKNTEMTNKSALGILKEQLIGIFEKQGIVRQIAKEKAETLLYGPMTYDKNGKPKGRRGGFTETKVNDAQSYITFKEFVRRIAARGQLKRYLPLIEKLLDETKELSAKDIKEFVQVQKNFYYDHYYDEEYGIFVPRQIKNSEFVLVPRFIRGTELEKVAEIMDKAGIDQLNTSETSKAANREHMTLWDDKGSLTILDKEGNIDENKLEEFARVAEGKAQLFDYSFLYTQQETPQHMDAANKAGIQIVKKIIDNIPEGHPLYDKKQEYFKVFCENIKQSYLDLMEEFNIPVDEYGNIVLEEGSLVLSPETKKAFYSRFKEELLRLGVDKNMLDYITIDNMGNPKMPSFLNIAVRKLESVAQSMFNGAITRQKLPGFHAAQTTRIGFKNLSKDGVGVSSDLRYHPQVEIKHEDGTVTKKVEPYIEVMLPLSAFGIDRNSPHYRGMSKDDILKELQAKGLDEVIGYRIPTEGKQSVCIMKCIAFLDDACGSTIVVPDNWVSQTGSDFDIDSVYGIQPETRTLYDGEVVKVDYKETFGEEDWVKTIGKEIEKELEKDDKYKNLLSAINSIKKDVKKEDSEYRKQQLKEVKDLEKNIRKVPFINTFLELGTKVVNNDINNTLLSNEELSLEYLREYYRRSIDLIVNKINEIKKIQANNSAAVAQLDAALNAVESYRKALKDYLSSVDDAKEYIKEEIYDRRLELYKQATEQLNADGVNIPTIEQFVSEANKKENRPHYNSKQARNTRIFDIMREILADPTSLEENLSRSNFDDVIANRDDVMDESVKDARKGRSAYNVFDQISYQEDATSGLALKGISVSLDTFCSVCNTVRPTLTKPIRIIYDTADFPSKAEAARAVGRFNSKPSRVGSTFEVSHDKYGWSNDNYNVAGKILTSYSSQTTAHILDAIKEGNIPGVNVYSFSVYKTIVNVGSDYKTAISFIMQPGVARIIANQEATNSVYSTSYGNPIHQAIRDIAKELGNVASDVTTPIASVIASINSNYRDRLAKILGIPDFSIHSLSDNDTASIPINVPLLVKRLHDEPITSPVEGMSEEEIAEQQRIDNLLFDFAQVLVFNRLNNIANQVGAVARCCNPDKFGAKQTIFATNEVFADMKRALYNENLNEKKKPILTCTRTRNGIEETVNILEGIYPGISEIADPAYIEETNPLRGIAERDLEESKYPTLFAYLKHASATSVVINRAIFDTQKPHIIHAIQSFRNKLSGYNSRLDEAMYNDMQNYIVSYVCNDVSSICMPYTLRQNDSGEYNLEYISPTGVDDGSDIVNTSKNLVEEERARVYGFGHSPNLRIPVLKDATKGTYDFISFEPENINHPTQEEVDLFNKFSPAQKIDWLKKHLRDTGVFRYLDVNLYNVGARGYRAGMQTIEFDEDSVSRNVIYSLFEDAFYNTNPLIKSAAVDLIKYAFLVEGYKISGRGITKIISNEPLIDSKSEGGLGFVDELKNVIDGVNTLNFDEDVDIIHERYLRSHPNTKGLRTIWLNKKNEKRFEPIYLSHGMISFYPSDTTDKKVVKEWYGNMRAAGICYEDEINDTYVFNEYVRIVSDNVNTLYKIKVFEDKVILYPLNNLESWECSEWSAREDNNIYKSREFYEALFKYYVAETDKNNFNSATEKAIRDLQGVVYTYEKRPSFNVQAESAVFTIVDEQGNIDKEFSRVNEVLSKPFSKPVTEPYYFLDNTLTDYIFTPGDEFSSPQKIKDVNGKLVSIRIAKLDTSFADKLLRKVHGAYTMTDAEFERRLNNIENPQIKQIVKLAREAELQSIDNAFVAYPDNTENTFYSIAAQEAAVPGLDFIAVQSRKGDESADKAKKNLNFSGIGEAGKMTKEDVATNEEIVQRELANYAVSKSRELSSLFDAFTQDPAVPDLKMSILDPRVQDLLKGKLTNNEDRRVIEDNYIKAINEVHAFLEVFHKYKDLKPEEEGADTKYYITAIQDAISLVESLDVAKAEHNLNESYLTSLSGNPLIKTDVIKIMDSFYKNHGGLWRFTDIMENGNPMLQVVMKEVMGDVEAKLQMGKRRKAEFIKEVKKLQKEAAAHGIKIDMNKFIDKNGRFILNYTNNFIDKLNDLKEAKNKAAAKGLGTVEYLKAKLDYDEFRARHIHQEAKQEYYLTRCKWERMMLYGWRGAYAEHYAKYMGLYFEKLQILDYRGNIGLTEEDLKELQRIDAEIYKLRHGDIVAQVSLENDADIPMFSEEDSVSKEEDPMKSLPSPEGMLDNFLLALGELNEKYFHYESVFGFEEQLKQYLDVVRRAEDRDGNGIPQKTQAQLEHDEKYQEAKRWLIENAQFEVVQTKNSKGNPTSIGSKIQAALKRLSLGGNNKNHLTNQMCREKGLYDELRIPDPTNLTDEDIKALKEAQMANFGMAPGTPDGMDKILIHTGPEDPVQYSKAFYANISLSGINHSKGAEYWKAVTRINQIIGKYYEPLDGVVHLERVPDTPEGIAELNELADLYRQLGTLDKKHYSPEDAQAISDFIEENVDTNPSEHSLNSFRAQYNIVSNYRSKEFFEAWAKVTYQASSKPNEDGSIQFLKGADGKYKLNRFLYDTFRPTAEALAKHPEWIDTQRQEDINLIHKYYRKTPTVYWYRKDAEMLKRAQEDPTFDYRQWWSDNHVWNPYTHQYELLDIWTTTEIKDELFESKEYEGRWIPRGRKRTKRVKDGTTKVNGRIYKIDSEDMRNHDYHKDGTLQQNYIVGSTSEDGTNYDSNLNLNDYEIRMRDLLQKTLEQTATTGQARRYFANGFMPARAKNTEPSWKRAAKETGKLFGINISSDTTKDFYEEVSYHNDRTPDMPMTHMLQDKEAGAIECTVPEPSMDDVDENGNPKYPTTSEGIAAFNKDKAEYLEAKKKVKEAKEKIHQDLLDRNWISVMEEYLDRSCRYNAILDNRERLFYLLHFLQNQKVYSRQHGYYGDLKTSRKSTPERPDYVKEIDSDLVKQYSTFIRRFMFDEWKADEGWLTNLGRRLQGFTSSNYMMLNYRGGVANVTVGETSIIAEAIAGEYFKGKDWVFGSGQWIAGSIGFVRSMYDDTSTNKQDAIAKFFAVVDYDEVTGVDNTLTMEKYSERIRSAMFHPQTVGEHFMQNSVLFAMLHSHKCITLGEDPSGIGAAFMNEDEYIRYKEIEELENILTDEQKKKLKEYKQRVIADTNELKEYAWWRKDILTDFIKLYVDKPARKEFLKKREKLQEKYRKEFKELDNLYDQVELGEDGYMAFKEGSDLAKLDEQLIQNGKVTKAFALTGKFSERVRKVNNKIHGVYNKLGQAYIEGRWFGSLVMQYHKHLPMGILKRYRAQGYFNETRGTVEKGVVQSIWDNFLNPYSLNNKAVQMKSNKFVKDGYWTNKNVTGLQALLFHLTHTFDYLAQVKDTWAVIPQSERANIWRNLGDAIGTLAGVALIIALLVGGDDDDDGLWYNFFLYEADRLSSESFMYNPIGLYTEGKTLFSQPVAVQSILSDGMSFITNTISWMLDDEHDLYYHSGQFAGRNRLSVYLERRTPIWNGIRSIRDIPRNNHYYKRGTKVVSLVDAKGIAKWLKGED